MGTAGPLLPDALWDAIAPLLPRPRPRPKGGRPTIASRAALTGLQFVLRSGLPWEMLLTEMGCGCVMSCWRRLPDWQEADVWARLHHVLLERQHAAGESDWGRASLDSASVPAEKGGSATDPTPKGRSKPVAKRHLVTMRAGRRSV